SETVLRAGRLGTLEIVLDDNSVSRRHAEVRLTPNGWMVRDLGSTNGTFLNGERLGSGGLPIKARDIIQFGKVAPVVEPPPDGSIESVGAQTAKDLVVEATASSSWEDALRGMAYDSNRCPRAGEQLVAMLRAGHHLGHCESED